MADPKKYFQFNVTPKLGVTPNQIHQNVRRKQIIQTLTDISDKKVKSAKQEAKQYQKQGGKLEQRQRVLDRLNSKQQFKNGGTLTQFLLKEGEL